MGKKFLHRLAGHFSNETAAATPNGKILGRSLEESLKKWRDLPEAERTKLDDLGAYDLLKDPAPPKGGLVLKVFARGLERDEKGSWQIYRHPKAHLTQEPGRDHLWLTEEEWRRLLSPDENLMPVPSDISDRLCRRYLIDLVRIGGEGGPRSKDNTVEQKLTLKRARTKGEAEIYTLSGTATFKTFGEEHGISGKTPRLDSFILRGRLVYDRRDKRFNEIKIAALSETGHYDQIGKKAAALGVAFELTPAMAPQDRVRPHSFYHDYFGMPVKKK